ncbi:MAG TPA: hypothetical protein VFC63_03765 [Blastocatellia bacterium]|nr:hypothetical protein [Blastocatellia bacterium]
MLRIWSVLKGVILWSYERGSWQYDIMVVVILLFVFATPNAWFKPALKTCDPAADYVDSNALVQSEQPKGTIEELIASYLRKKRGDEFRIDRIEPKLDADKRVQGYCVWVEPANQSK